MKSPFKSTGLFVASIFLLAAIYNIAFGLTVNQAITTYIAFNIATCLGMAAVFVASALLPKLAWIQPLCFLGTAPLAILEDARSMYGLGLFAMGVILLFRLGFFGKWLVPKILFLFVYFIAWVVASYVLNPGMPLSVISGPMFFMTAFLLFLYFTFEGRIAVYMKEPKERLSLLGKGLSPAEQTYVLAMVGGKTMKEISIDFELSESTVRNIMARAYKKLGVEDKSGLATLAERFEIVA